MIGLRRLGVDHAEEMLRVARAFHLGQASDKDYRREMRKAERDLNGQ